MRHSFFLRQLRFVARAACPLGLLMVLGTASSGNAQIDTLNLSRSSGALKVSPLELDIPASEHQVRIHCDDEVNCSSLQAHAVVSQGSDVRLDVSCGSDSNSSNCGRSGGQILIPPRTVSDFTKLKLMLNNSGEILEVQLRGARALQDSGGNAQERPALLRSLTWDCRDQLDLISSGTYVEGDSATVAQFVVTPFGQVLARPRVDQVDENDFVRVYVVGDSTLLSRLSVNRSSEFRAPNVVTILGADASPIDLQSDRQPKCDRREFLLADFAAGEAAFKIQIREEGRLSDLAEVHFGVNRLYDGSFSLGAIWSTLGDPEFGLVPKGDSTIITQIRDPASGEKDDRGDRTLWAIFYTPFFVGNDIRKSEIRVSPTFGAVLNDVFANVLVGGSIDYRSNFRITAGAHFGRVVDLDERSELSLGSPFEGQLSDIPTVEKLDVGFFVGVALDMRAAFELVRLALAGVGNE